MGNPPYGGPLLPEPEAAILQQNVKIANQYAALGCVKQGQAMLHYVYLEACLRDLGGDKNAPQLVWAYDQAIKGYRQTWGC